MITEIATLFSVGENLINKFFPDPNQRAEQLHKLKELEQKGDLALLNAHVQQMIGQLEINKDCPPTPYNITAAKVGDIGFVGLGGEVLTEIGLSIKKASPFRYTFVITHCNGAAGYLAPEHLYVEGGYEISSSPFAPKAAGIVVKQTVKMLHEL